MRLSIGVLLTSLLLGCSRDQHQLNLISTPGSTAESVYVTQDHKKNPVVVWTERSGEDLKLFLAISEDDGKSFANKLTLALTNDVATHAEGMPKIAFKNDGTIIAAYEKKAPTPDNKYAGAICYRVSRDRGATWTPEKFVHCDTIAGRSRSYFDIERLPDGEIGASWLDIKLNVETGGRSVRFARTDGSLDFKNELLIDSSACQCCRIDVYADLAGRINIAYRGLSKGLMGKTIRDMMISTSIDNGKNFSVPEKISNDNWEIDGCPHTGPSLCSSKGGLHSIWYTEGNGTGIYYSFKHQGGKEFGKREVLSINGHHPQLSADDTRSIVVWEEASSEPDEKHKSIRYQISSETNVTRACLTQNSTNAFSPVVTQTSNGFLVAFLMETADGIGMYLTKLQ